RPDQPALGAVSVAGRNLLAHEMACVACASPRDDLGGSLLAAYPKIAHHWQQRTGAARLLTPESFSRQLQCLLPQLPPDVPGLGHHLIEVGTNQRNELLTFCLNHHAQRATDGQPQSSRCGPCSMFIDKHEARLGRQRQGNSRRLARIERWWDTWIGRYGVDDDP